MPRIATMIGVTVMISLVLLAGACGGDSADSTSTPLPNMQAQVDHPLVPWTSTIETIFEGEETDPDTGETIALRVESRVQQKTAIIAGIEVTVVEVRDIEDGELVELTRDYYAQNADGEVYYMGEDVDDYEDGEVVGHGGAWIAGEGENQAGVFMPANPQVGDEFEQERAPGRAEDRSAVVEVGLTITVPAGTFSDCIETEDFDPIDEVTESKFYCPGVGLVREESEDGFIELISYQ